MRLSFAFMAVEQRRAHVERVAERLAQQIPTTHEFGGVQVCYDHELKGTWGPWQRAWNARAEGATHHVVLQDDVLICADLPATMLALAKARPDDLVSGFLPRRAIDRAVQNGKHWVRTRRFLWAQCVMMPVAMGDDFVLWANTHEQPAWSHHDDVRMQAYLSSINRAAWVAVPHPVEHVGDELPGGSVLHHHGSPHRRRARAWLGQDGCGAHLPWHELAFERDA